MRKIGVFITLLLCSMSFSVWADEKTTIGVIVPLSSETQLWGEGIRRGLDLYADSVGGRMQFVYEDEAFCDSKRAVAAAKKLLEMNKVKIIITACLNGTKAIQAIAQRHSATILSAGLLDQSSITDFENVISLAAQIGTEAEFLAKYVKQRGYKNLVVFRHEDTFTLEFYRQFEKAMSGADVKISEVPVADPAFPFQTRLAKARVDRHDAYLVYLGNDELLNFMKAHQTLQDETPVLSGYIVESNFDAQKFGGLLDELVYSYPALSNRDSSKRKQFEAEFTAKFGKDAKPTVNTYFTYDGMQVLSEAIKKCGGVESSCIQSYYTEAGRDWSGVSGRFAYQTSGAIEREFILKRVNDSKFELLG